MGVVAGGEVSTAVVRDPGGDTDEVGDEGRDDTLEDGRVAPDHVFIVHLRLVELRHHWAGKVKVSTHTPTP